MLSLAPLLTGAPAANADGAMTPSSLAALSTNATSCPHVINSTHSITCNLGTQAQLLRRSPQLMELAAAWDGHTETFPKAFTAAYALDDPEGSEMGSFKRAQDETSAMLRSFGMTKESTVLEVGCGTLRAGRSLISDDLAPGHYYGIESNKTSLAIGVHLYLGLWAAAEQKPNFATTGPFDLGVFGKKFDLVIARSAWTHASLTQIEAMLASFVDVARPGSKLIVSYWNSPDDNKYEADGKLVKGLAPPLSSSAISSNVAYTKETLELACTANGLKMKQLSPKEVAERTGGNHAHMPTKGWEQKQAWAVIEPAE
tara:strand:- start:207 stop:1148 length:942 start_codon:yes stop_codon:yes gene_type:complete